MQAPFVGMFASLSSGWASTTGRYWPQWEINKVSFPRTQRRIANSRIEPEVSNLSITIPTLYHWAIAAIRIVKAYLIVKYKNSVIAKFALSFTAQIHRGKTYHFKDKIQIFPCFFISIQFFKRRSTPQSSFHIVFFQFQDFIAILLRFFPFFQPQVRQGAIIDRGSCTNQTNATRVVSQSLLKITYKINKLIKTLFINQFLWSV